MHKRDLFTDPQGVGGKGLKDFMFAIVHLYQDEACMRSESLCVSIAKSCSEIFASQIFQEPTATPVLIAQMLVHRYTWLVANCLKCERSEGGGHYCM